MVCRQIEGTDMTAVKVLMMVFAVIFMAAPVLAGDSKTSPPFHINAYLCDTPQYAIELASTESRGTEEEVANDIVGRAHKKEVCGKFIGFASVQEQKTILKDGITYKVTALQFKEDDRIAWTAEPQK
jgi:hypothetical protein